MEWAAIIAMILQVIDPLLQEWVKKCTEERLEDAASSLPDASTFSGEGAAASALFDQAIANLPRFAFVRRAALRRAKSIMVVNGELRRTPLSADELEEGRDLVNGVKQEI